MEKLKAKFKQSLIYFVWRYGVTDDLSFYAGGVAFYALLSIFPLLSALVSMYGLIADTADIQIILNLTQEFLPQDAFVILSDQLNALISKSNPKLGVTFVVSILISMASASRGMRAMMAALNKVYLVEEKRVWWKHSIIAYMLTLGGVMALACSVAVLVLVPVIMDFFPIPEILMPKIKFLRWFILGGSFVLLIGGLFILGPNKPLSHKGGLFAGLLSSAGLLMGLSYGLSVFIGMFPSFNAVYGSFGAIIIFMTWLFLSIYAILIGAAIHAGFEIRLKHMNGDLS